jgi:hypothetical protein
MRRRPGRVNGSPRFLAGGATSAISGPRGLPSSRCPVGVAVSGSCPRC